LLYDNQQTFGNCWTADIGLKKFFLFYLGILGSFYICDGKRRYAVSDELKDDVNQTEYKEYDKFQLQDVIRPGSQQIIKSCTWWFSIQVYIIRPQHNIDGINDSGQDVDSDPGPDNIHFFQIKTIYDGTIQGRHHQNRM
jgi:hypothetical protein